jgi:hypothetical protein
MAARIEAQEKARAEGPNADPFTAACDAPFPPSASDLAAALAHRAKYDGFERPRRRISELMSGKSQEIAQLLRYIADLTEIGPSVPPLLPVASYYEYTLDREKLWKDLKRIFDQKKTPTSAHELVARAAQHHLGLKPRRDYLIITTNYDCLIELALSRLHVPYCVLTVVNSDQYVDVTFPEALREYLALDSSEFEEVKAEHAHKYPKGFTLQLGQPVVLVYKLHGDLFPQQPGRDSVVLSDEDYIRYLMRMQDAAGMIPSEITTLIESPAFLLLGYSFSDWNVRAVYKAVVRQRTQERQKNVRDYAVVREINVYETAYVGEGGGGHIHRLITDLSKFAAGILAHAPVTKEPAGL